MVEWNSAQYLKFQRERTQPSIDLAARIECPMARRILDIGCGPGNSSRVLAGRFPEASILGVDNSAQMIATAREEHPDLEFTLCDVPADLGQLGGEFDVVFSNACIQWIPDHPSLLPQMLALLRPGGVLAIQIPMNQQEPIHRIITELVQGKWRAALSSLRLFHTLTPGEYFDLLAALPVEFTLWQTTYFHVLDSRAEIMEWYRGTGLRPYLQALPEGAATEFEADVFARVQKSYPVQSNEQVIFRFPRFFLLAKQVG